MYALGRFGIRDSERRSLVGFGVLMGTTGLTLDVINEVVGRMHHRRLVGQVSTKHCRYHQQRSLLYE